MNKKKVRIITISAVAVIAVISTLFAVMSKSQVQARNFSSSNFSSQNISTAPVDVLPVSSAISSSSGLTSTEITADVTQSKAAYSSSNTSAAKVSAVSVAASSQRIASSESSSSSANNQTSSNISSAVSSSAPQIPEVPTSQEVVTKTIGNNTIKLNVNAFTFEAFVDWSDVQNYLLDDFYVKVYKNGVLKSGPTLYGCVTKDPTNTVAVEIDTYQSSGHWHIQPATYKIECYSQLGAHSMITDNRPQIIPCPSATFTVSINEKGFQ